MFNQLTKKYRLFLAVFSLLLGLTIATVTNGQAITGFIFAGSKTPNNVSVITTEYRGECPGFQQPEIEAWFTSSTTPTAAKRRVIIYNKTLGLNPQKIPYTDREYEEGNFSESTKMEFGIEHSKRRFRILEGENNFEYEIKQKNTVLETGTFNATINNNLQVVERNSTCKTETNICANPSVSSSSCADLRTRTQCSCPNGTIISTTWQPEGEVKTLISNQTKTSIFYELNSYGSYLIPGQDRWYEGDNLGMIYYDNNKGQRDSAYLTPGKRYRFKRTNDGLIKLEEWTRW